MNILIKRIFQRSLVFPDINECRDVINIVLDAIKNADSEHYESLVSIYNSCINMDG